MDWQGKPMWGPLPALPPFGVAIAGTAGVVPHATADRMFMALAYVVAARSWAGPSGPNLRVGHGVVAGFNIAGVLASPSGTIHAWAVNTNAQNSSRHAETNIVQSLGAIPAGATSIRRSSRVSCAQGCSCTLGVRGASTASVIPIW